MKRYALNDFSVFIIMKRYVINVFSVFIFSLVNVVSHILNDIMIEGTSPQIDIENY